MKSKIFTLFALWALALTGWGFAQESGYSHPVSVPGIRSQITVYTSAPAGFDPVNASDEELQTYGFPRRPDINDTRIYQDWKRAVSAERIEPELVAVPGRYHRPNHVTETGETVRNTSALTSGNWSGFALVGGTEFDQVQGVWIVPNVGGAEKAGIKGYSSMWVGLDGDCKCNDLVQDGTESDYVNGKAIYDAWIEFIPEPEVKIPNFAVQPGDVIGAYSTVGTKNGKLYGIYYIVNYNTNKAVSASLVMPSGDKYVGATAEWIVERTEVGGSFANPMPHYANAYMNDAVAFRVGSSHAYSYSSGANQNITMKASNGHTLSKASQQDSVSIWYQWVGYN